MTMCSMRQIFLHFAVAGNHSLVITFVQFFSVCALSLIENWEFCCIHYFRKVRAALTLSVK